MADQQFCLRWNNHQSTLISVFDSLLENGTLVDCTLAAEGKYLKAHKVVLSACSPYLETLLSQHYEKHPIVILKDVKFTELKSMMDYMYRGEVNISQDQLGTFLKAAESLQIKGLSDNGADGDGRDVGSTSKGPPPRKTQPAASTRPVESQRSDLAPASPAHRSRDGSISPSSRKRRRTRRNSQDDDANMGDSHLDSNSCDLPSQAQSTPIVPNIPAAVTSSITTTPIKTIVKPEQTELVNRIDTSNLNSLPPESGLLKEKIEPISEPLLEPKTEYLDDANNDDSVEDLTLDDDDEMDEMDMSNMSNMSNMSRPGPSHGNDVSNQGFVPWQIGNQSGTDEVFMAAQEAVQAHRGDSQEGGGSATKRAPQAPSSPPRERRTSTSPESFAGFSPREITKKRFIVLPETPAVRVSQPRTSKSRAPLVWKKGGRFIEETIKVEPVDVNETPPTVQSKSVEEGTGLLGRSKRIKKPKTYDSDKELKEVKKESPNKSKTNSIIKQKVKEIDETVEVKSEPLEDDDVPSTSSTSSDVQEYNFNNSKTSKMKRRMKKRSNSTNGFKCDQCGRKYKYLRGLRQHKKLECNKEPQFPCPYCPSRFRYRQNIREHVRNNHEQAFPRWYATHYVAPMFL